MPKEGPKTRRLRWVLIGLLLAVASPGYLFARVVWS